MVSSSKRDEPWHTVWEDLPVWLGRDLHRPRQSLAWSCILVEFVAVEAAFAAAAALAWLGAAFLSSLSLQKQHSQHSAADAALPAVHTVADMETTLALSPAMMFEQGR